MNGTNLFDELAAALTAWLSNGLESLFGPGVRRPAFDAVSWADLGVVAVLLLLVLGVNGLAAAFLRRKIRQAAAMPVAKGWRHDILGALGKPLYLLIWVCGVYLAFAPLRLKLPADMELQVVRQFFDRLIGFGVFAVLLWLFLRLTRVLETRLGSWAARTQSKLDDLFVPLLGRSLRVIVLLVGVIFALPAIGLPPEYAGMFGQGSSILLIGAVAWVLFQAVHVGEKTVLARYDITAADNLQARKLYTQVHVLARTLYVLIAIFTVASVLMLFEEVRRFGTSILASAGVIGLIAGFAAQKTIANLFAGFQLAMTQPIRLDDVVIVEGECGRIEEITLAYVVVRIWDDRRLVVPLSYFIEKPFQNWTRASSDLLGSVFVWVDYALPLEEVRKALKGIIETHPLWDKRFWNLQVTDTSEQAVQIRVLATAADSTKLWDLRCDIREKLVAHIQKHHPHSLPQRRNRSVEPNAERT